MGGLVELAVASVFVMNTKATLFFLLFHISVITVISSRSYGSEFRIIVYSWFHRTGNGFRVRGRYKIISCEPLSSPQHWTFATTSWSFSCKVNLLTKHQEKFSCGVDDQNGSFVNLTSSSVLAPNPNLLHCLNLFRSVLPCWCTGRHHVEMLTYRLILPSIICLKVLPLNVNAACGSYKWRTQSCVSLLIRLIFYSLLLLRVLQLSLTIHRIATSSYEMESLPDATMTTIVSASLIICITLVCIIWNVEFWRKEEELVTLLRFLDVNAPTRKCDVIRRKPRRKKSTVLSRAYELSDLIWRLLTDLRGYIRLAWRDFQLMKPTMTSKDVCTMLTPFAVNLFIPFAYVCLYLRTPFQWLAVSALSAEQLERRPVVAILLGLVDAVLCFYGALTFHAGFYFGFLIESWCISRLRSLREQTE